MNDVFKPIQDFSVQHLSNLINQIGREKIERVLINNVLYQQVRMRKRSIFSTSAAEFDPAGEFEDCTLEIVMNLTVPPFMIILK